MTTISPPLSLSPNLEIICFDFTHLRAPSMRISAYGPARHHRASSGFVLFVLISRKFEIFDNRFAFSVVQDTFVGSQKFSYMSCKLFMRQMTIAKGGIAATVGSRCGSVTSDSNLAGPAKPSVFSLILAYIMKDCSP